MQTVMSLSGNNSAASSSDDENAESGAVVTAAGADEGEAVDHQPLRLPIKRLYRQRAHCNPWSDHSLDDPTCPAEVDWLDYFTPPPPLVGDTKGDGSAPPHDEKVRFVDVGCGYGGLLMALATAYPDVRSLGLEIRLKVCDYVQEKIRALRDQSGHKQYGNIACIRTNAMRFLPNYIEKGQLTKLFFLYPDPHFKRVKHKWRIITPSLLATYAYLLAPGGRLYSATDVPELAAWQVARLQRHRLFAKRLHVCLRSAAVTSGTGDESVVITVMLPSEVAAAKQMSSDGKAEEGELEEEKATKSGDLLLPETAVDEQQLAEAQAEYERVAREDPVVRMLALGCTEEAKKAAREGRGTSIVVFERLPDPVY